MLIKTTEYWYDSRWQGSKPLITILVMPIILLLYNTERLVVEAEYYLEDGYNINSYTNYNDLDVRNLSCIPHDTKYTCDCQNINQKFEFPALSGTIYQIEIRNCKSLSIRAHVLSDLLGLRKITFYNVQNLTLAKYALAFPLYASNTPLILTFEKVNILLIDSHAINGHIEEIIFIGSQIDTINAFAFTILKEQAMLFKMDHTRIKRLESQAFKKFLIEQIDIENCEFETNVPSKTFYEVEVMNTLNINNVHFKNVHTRAFSFKKISKLIIRNNTFNGVDAEWLHVFVKDSAIIRNNNFGRISPISFAGIQMHRKHMFNEKLELNFSNNTVYSSDGLYPLEFNDTLLLNLKHLKYDNSFVCNNEVDYTKKIPQPKSNFFRQYKDSIYFRTNNTNEENFIVLSKLIELECQLPVNYWLYIVVGIIGIILILIAIGMGIWCQIQKKRKRLKLDIIQPEPRTYKETQIIYQIENAGLLKTDL